MPSASDLPPVPRVHPLPEGASITPPGQRPDEEPSLAVRNNGGVAPSSAPGPGRTAGGAAGARLRRPRGARRRDAVPGERHPRPRHPAGAAGGGRRALPPLRRRQPDQRPEPGAGRGAGGELADAGLDLPVYWGNRNWAPYVEDTWRQMAEDGIEHAYVLRHVGLRLVLRLPAVPRGHRPRPGRAGVRPDRAGRADRREAAALLRRARLRAGQRRGARRRARVAARRPAGRRPAGRDRAQHPRRDGRRRRAGRRRLPGRAAAGRPPGRRRRGAGPAGSTWSGRAAAGRRRCRGWSPTSTTTCRALAAAGERAVVAAAGRLRQRPPRGGLGPRQRGAGDRRRARAGLRPRRDRRHAPGVRRVAARAARGAPGGRRPAAGHRLPGGVLLRAAAAP